MSDSQASIRGASQPITTPAPSDVTAEASFISGEEEPQEDVESSLTRQREKIKQRFALGGISLSSWSRETEEVVDKFLSDASVRLLLAYLHPSLGLVVEQVVPCALPERFCFFTRSEESSVTEENFHSVCGRTDAALLRLMGDVLHPLVTHYTAWQESTKNDYCLHLHRFLTSLTDAQSRLLGRTVLYVPQEARELQPEEAVKNTLLIHRLEMVMIHWTRQMRSVLHAQDVLEMGDTSGPLDELAFWKRRSADLHGIDRQLQKPEVRHVTEILQLYNSFYVQPFCEQAKLVQESSSQAECNISFLSLLVEPCEELRRLKLHQLTPKLQHVLRLMRLVWLHCGYYGDPDRITALFSKMSNVVVQLCCREISLPGIFQGHVTSSTQTLHHCVQCCQAWEELYLQTAQRHNTLSPQAWSLDSTVIFAVVKAFVQRCLELKEVCESQRQFARREEGGRAPLPCFAGHKGPEIRQKLLDIEASFEKSLQTLSAAEDILNVKNPSWHKEYRRFHHEVKLLEVKMQDLITSAFETVVSVEEGVELLDVFQYLSAREAVRRTIEQKTLDVYDMFDAETSAINHLLCAGDSLSPAHSPHHAAQARWTLTLRSRIQRPLELLQQADFLSHHKSREEVMERGKHLSQALDETLRKIFIGWSQSLDRDCVGLLDQTLMTSCREKSGLLDVNFNKKLLKMFHEIDFWKRLPLEVPHYASEVYQRRDELHVLRENVLLVVRDYNRIITALNADERCLFSEKIRFLDKKLQPGLTKLLWSSRGRIDVFIRDCRAHAATVQAMVDEYKAANVSVCELCAEISHHLLVRVDHHIFPAQHFQQEQQKLQRSRFLLLQDTHRELVRILSAVYATFQSDANLVQQHWSSYLERTDVMVETAFAQNVKLSLLELCKAIGADGRTSPSAVFKVEVVLSPDSADSAAQVDFSPSPHKLSVMVNGVFSQLISIVSAFQRLPDLVTHQPSAKQPIHLIIEQDEEICKLQTAIAASMMSTASQLHSYLKSWDKYREIWEIEKDSFLQRYKRLNPTVSSFDNDIARYTEAAINIQKEETLLSLEFVLLDSSPLKFSLLQHCNEWESKFTQLLSLMATNTLRELHHFMQENALRACQPPQTLKELDEGQKRLDTLRADLREIESQIPSVHEQFDILEKYGVSVETSVCEMLKALDGEWLWFQQVLTDSDVMLKKQRDLLKSEHTHADPDAFYGDTAQHTHLS